MATRFALLESETTPVTPGFAAWSRTTEGVRRRMSPTKDASAAANQTFWAGGAAAADESALARQYVSDPMASGIAFVTTDTIKCHVRCQESAVNDNINRQPICVKVYSEDGTTLRATLKALGHIGPNTTEWLNTGLRNKTLADGDTLDANYTTVLGDRLVIEVGGQASSAGGTSVTGTMSFGANTTDLGENETDTTALDPWFEISRTVTFAPTAYTLTAESGTFTETGTAATLKVGRLLTAGSGSFTETGTAATLVWGKVLAAGSGSFALTGSDVTFSRIYALVAESGSFTLTGTAAGLAYGKVLAAESGTFTATGADAGLLFGRRLAADSGSFTETGTDAALLFGRALAAGSGSFTETGADAGLLFGRRVGADSGSFVLAGADATLTVGAAGNYTLTAESGTFTLSGTAAGLLATRLLSADAGIYSLTGTDATLTYSGFVVTTTAQITRVTLAPSISRVTLAASRTAVTLATSKSYLGEIP